MRRRLTLIISCLVLFPMLIGIGCGGSERSHDDIIGSPVSAAGFYVLKAAGGQAVSWGTSRALDHFRGDGEAQDAEAIQNSLTQIHADTTAIRNSLDGLQAQVAMVDWRLSVGSIAAYTTSIRTQWDHYQNYLGINPIDGAPRPDGPEDQPDEAYWTEIVKPDGVREDLRELHYFMTDKPIEAAHQGLLESCAEYLLDKNPRDSREPAILGSMIAYFEQTFLELVDYQCRGFVLYRESYHVLEETNPEAVVGKQRPESYLAQDLRPAIRLQAFEFLRCAERLLVDNINLAADAGPDGTGVMEVPTHWLYAGEVPAEHLRVFPEGGKEMLERATLTAVKVLSYVDEQFINMRETEEDIFIAHVIGDPTNVALSPAQYLQDYLTIPSGATFDGTLLRKDSAVHGFSIPAEFTGTDHEDGLRIGSGEYIQFYRRNMKTLPLQYTTEGDNTSENRVNRRLYVGFKEADSIDAAAYRVTGSRPGDWEVHREEILQPANSELGDDSIQFGHALYSARPIGSYLGFARSVQDLQLIDSNPYRDYTQIVARTLPEFGPPVASRSMSGWSSASCARDHYGAHRCNARWLYRYGLKCHLDYSGTESFTMNLRPAVLVDRRSIDYDRVMIDGVTLDNQEEVDGGHLYRASQDRSLHFVGGTPDRFKSTTVQVISESSSGLGCHNWFKPDQNMSLQSLSIVR